MVHKLRRFDPLSILDPLNALKPLEDLVLPRGALAQSDGGLSKPGCAVADNVLLVQGHLGGLARGLSGFGVLRQSREKLLEAAAQAERLGRTDFGERLRDVAERLPEVHDQEGAERALEQVEPLADEAWEMGRTCKALTVTDLERAIRLGNAVSGGKMTVAEAKKQFLGGS